METSAVEHQNRNSSPLTALGGSHRITRERSGSTTSPRDGFLSAIKDVTSSTNQPNDDRRLYSVGCRSSTPPRSCSRPIGITSRQGCCLLANLNKHI